MLEKNACSRVTILGLGYIGLPTAALIANQKISVNGFDVNQEVTHTIAKGEVHIVEPGLKELVQSAVASGHLSASTELQAADVYLVVVPTPFKQDKQPDTSFVEAAIRSIIPLLKKNDLVIIESTSPVLTTEKMAQIIFSEKPELKYAIKIAYCPERVLPGNALEEMVNNEDRKRVV